MTAAVWQRGAEGTFGEDAFEMLRWLGPALLAAVLLAALGKALLRHRRYRARGVLGASDQEAVHEALRAAERRTIGEIVPVVFEQSDAHPVARWRAMAVAVLLGQALLAPWLPWHAPHWMLAAQVGFALAAAALALLPDLRRTFVGEARASEVSEEQALQMFFRLGLHATAERTGVLIFVSLFERRVVVLADAGIDAEVPDAAAWTAAKDAVLAGIARGNLRDGLIAGIGEVGAVLAAHFPWREGDRDELPDRLVVERG